MKIPVCVIVMLSAISCIYAENSFSRTNGGAASGIKAEKKFAGKDDDKNIRKPASMNDYVKKAKAKAMERMAEDSKTYSSVELEEIEELYQAAKGELDSSKDKRNLKKLITKYKKANRSGCMLMMLAEVSKGKKKEEYFKQAMDDHFDCYYGDGVQVGPYAMFKLYIYYKSQGQKSKAEALIKELKDKYPDAIDHRGALLSSDPQGYNAQLN